jgi:hypothetical protein
MLLLVATSVASFAQTPPCPNPPPVTISPNPPSDVCIPTGFPGNPIAFFDDFSWRSFIAMVWPVLEGMRGIPDDSKSIGPVTTPLVFETLKADWEVFQPPNGANPPPAPSQFNTYAGANPCAGFGLPSVGFGQLVLASFSKFDNLGEAGFGNLVGPVPAQSGFYTRYFTAFNQTEFNQILSQSLYLRDNLKHGVTFSPGSIDVKAAWINMAGVQNPQRYYTRTAWVLNPFSTPDPTCTPITVGLVGLHIVQKTPSRPQWIWSTFEQIDNVPGGTSSGPFAYNSGNAKAMPNSNPLSFPPTLGEPIPAVHLFNVQRLTPIHPSTIAINAKYQGALQGKGGPWQFYQLVMTQWPLVPSQPSQPGTPNNTFPGLNNSSSAFANVALETFDQTNIRTGCMSCHTQTSTTNPSECSATKICTDFLWSLNLNAYPSALAPPSEPMLVLRSRPQLTLAARKLSPQLQALKQLMQAARTR